MGSGVGHLTLPPAVPRLVAAGWARAGRAAPADLRAFAGTAPDNAAVGFAAPRGPVGALVVAHDLGLDYERQLDAEARTAGAHYTPIDVAQELAARVLTDVGSRARATVWDPACGAGALLLAAAEVLLAAGRSAQEIVDDLLWGTDTDPAAVAVAEAALVLWATLHGAPDARPGSHLTVADALAADPDDGDGPGGAGPHEHGPGLVGPEGGNDRGAAAPPPGGHGYVLGNPPFQGQVAGASVRSGAGRHALRRRWGPVVGPYTDTSTLFLVAGVHALARGGRLGMILPTSVLAARDATAARRHLDDIADLVGLWVAVEPVFAASVDVCAPVLVRRDPMVSGGEVGPAPTTERWRRRGFEVLAPTTRAGRRWSELALVAHDVPLPAHRTAGRLGDVAEASSGFRDEYYGMVDHVSEAPVLGPGDLEPDGLRPLVTSGLIDPGRCHWGERPVRFAKQAYARPVVDVSTLRAAAALGGPAARAAAWLDATTGPKVVVATQTRVGEATVDEAGCWVPSTPTIVVRPTDGATGGSKDGATSGSTEGATDGSTDGSSEGSTGAAVPGASAGDRLWALAAVVCSPLGTVVALADTFGSARSVQAIKPSATSVLDLPLPVDREAWAAGAAALRRHDREAFVRAMADAYGIDPATAPALHEWWAARAPWSAP